MPTLAKMTGVPDENIFIMDNGDCLEITEDSIRIAERVESGVVYVDGLSVGDVGQVVIRDRQLLARDGIATIIIAIDRQDGHPVGEPELVTRGISLSEADPAFMDEARARIAKTLAKTAREGATDHGVIKNAVRESLSQFMWERTRSRPMIIPVVMEV
jgi:ribonuclease J